MKILKLIKKEIEKNFKNYVVVRAGHEYVGEGELFSSYECERLSLFDAIRDEYYNTLYLSELVSFYKETNNNINKVVLYCISSLENYQDATDTITVYENSELADSVDYHSEEEFFESFQNEDEDEDTHTILVYRNYRYSKNSLLAKIYNVPKDLSYTELHKKLCNNKINFSEFISNKNSYEWNNYYFQTKKEINDKEDLDIFLQAEDYETINFEDLEI